ncbi:MAG: hypothetical protein LBH40_00005, partial [Alphaproteobacteria bacterium]|nr:hypothetical protein [Alphaproteobacteria bacterium]
MSIKQVININSLTNSKKTIKIKATEEDTIYLAKETGVVKFLSLEATVSITRSMNRFKVDGEIIADIIQEDAINLEEINTRLQLPIKRIYEIP